MLLFVHCVPTEEGHFRNILAISPTDPREWGATLRRPGTPEALFLHMADGWFQNLDRHTNGDFTDETTV